MYSDNELRDVARLFGLTVIGRDEMPCGSKWMGARYAIATDTGKFFLKIHSDWWPTAQTEYVCALLHDLKAEGFPVASIRWTSDGEPFALWRGHVCECHEFMDGQAHALGNLDQVAAAGRTLSRLHALTETRARPGDNLPDSCGYPGEGRVRFFAERVRDIFADDASAKETLEQLLSSLRAVPRSEHDTVAHGDYHPANMIFQENDILAICDFDLAQEAPRAFDLAYFLYRAAGRPNRSGGGPVRLDRAVSLAFLEGYGCDRQAPLASLRNIGSEMLRFAWFNTLLVTHNTRSAAKLGEWSADTVALAENVEQWTEDDLPCQQ